MTYITIRARVPQEVADAIKAGRMRVGGRSKELSDSLKGDYSQLFSQAGVVDLQPADNGATKTREVWVPYFNERGQIMITAPVVYRIGQNGTPELVKSVRDDLYKSWLVANTGSIYDPDTLEARIVHNHGSTIFKKPTERRVVVPVYQGAPLPEVLGTDQGLACLRAYFDTKDGKDEIEKTLVALSGEEVSNIRIWTPDQKNRASYPERAAVFGFDGVRFHVGGGGVDGSGRSRGVSVKSAKPTRKNKG